MSYLSPRSQECILLLHSLHLLLLWIIIFLQIIHFIVIFNQNSLFLQFPSSLAHSLFPLIFQLIPILFINLQNLHYQIGTIENLLLFNLHFTHRLHQNIHCQIHHHLKFINHFTNPQIIFPFTHLNLFLILKFNEFDPNHHFSLMKIPPLLHFQIDFLKIALHHLSNLPINNQVVHINLILRI